MYGNISVSPGGDYVMVNRIEKPFSYLVPYYRFPSVTTVYDQNAKLVQIVNEEPLVEDSAQRIHGHAKRAPLRKLAR